MEPSVSVPMEKPTRPAEVVAADPADIFKVVLGGIPAQNGRVPMPSFASQLNDQQIAQIANYVRTSWGNAAAPTATAAMVSKLRGKQ